VLRCVFAVLVLLGRFCFAVSWSKGGKSSRPRGKKGLAKLKSMFKNMLREEVVGLASKGPGLFRRVGMGPWWLYGVECVNRPRVGLADWRDAWNWICFGLLGSDVGCGRGKGGGTGPKAKLGRKSGDCFFCWFERSQSLEVGRGVGGGLRTSLWGGGRGIGGTNYYVEVGVCSGLFQIKKKGEVGFGVVGGAGA